GLAGGELVQQAVEAAPAGDHEGDHHAVAGPHPAHLRPRLLDDAHELVAEDVAIFHARDLAAVDVQVRTADRGRGHAHDDVVRLRERGIGHGFNADILRSVVGQGLHGGTPCARKVRGWGAGHQCTVIDVRGCADGALMPAWRDSVGAASAAIGSRTDAQSEAPVAAEAAPTDAEGLDRSRRRTQIQRSTSRTHPMTSNPLLDFSGLPRFDAIRPEHVGPAVAQLLEEAGATVRAAEVVAEPTWDDFVLPLDEATSRLARAWGQVAHLEAVASTPPLRAAYNEALPAVTRFWAALGQNRALFAQYRRMADAPGFKGSSEARRQAVENALRDFRPGGAELDEAGRARHAAIREELSALGAKFSQNVLDATDAWALYVDDEAQLSGLPADVLAACRDAAQREGREGWKLGLQMPVYLAVQSLADDRELRATLYRANAVRASELGDDPALDNSTLVDRILALRAELAALLGFDSYAAYSLATKMADTPDQVQAFLRDLAARAKPHAQRDRAELEAFAREHLGLEALEAWDLGYASEKLKQARYSFSAQEVKQYFTEPKVLAGLFGVIGDLYGLRVEPDSAPTWHEDVRVLRLVDGDGKLVGQFYFDLYAREGKRGGAWMDDCRNRRDTARGTQTPLVYLVCNFGKGVDGKPATFTHSDVTTLF